MFGITRLTPQEKKEHLRVKRISELVVLINKESLSRSVSLAKAEAYNKELNILTK